LNSKEFIVDYTKLFFLIVVLIFICNNKANAQDEDSSQIIFENGWIEKMDNDISFRLAVNNDIEIFMVDTEQDDFELYPNTSNICNLNASYKFISFGYSFAPGF
jgi:hypothetical protein